MGAVGRGWDLPLAARCCSSEIERGSTSGLALRKELTNLQKKQTRRGRRGAVFPGAPLWDVRPQLFSRV